MSGGRAGALAAIFLAALALRPQIVGAGPLFPLVQDDLGVSHAVVGLLGTIPVLCMGLFAPPAGWVAGRTGTRLAITLCLGLIAGFGIARALVPEAALLVALTFPVGVGMGLAGALLPVAVKEHFPDRPGFATGVYATGIQVGSGASSMLSVPIAHAAGGWRASLLTFSVATVGLLAAWVLFTRGGPGRPVERLPLPRPPLTSPLGWHLVLVFALMGLGYYGLNAWLPASYVERGWSEASAGALLGVLNVAAIPASLLVPWLSDRAGSRRGYLGACGLLLVGGLVGLVLAPGGAYVWSGVVGFANGAMFPLVLTLPLDVEDRPARVGALVGMMLGVGYVLAALSPFALGAIRDATGSFTGALWVVVAVGALWLIAVLPLSRRRLGLGSAPLPPG
ncbi:MAG TPA: MFS transporter [Gaiellaceae bacterium]|nr:MFS transporter [Gaiellaceae bacterium]